MLYQHDSRSAFGPASLDAETREHIFMTWLMMYPDMLDIVTYCLGARLTDGKNNFTAIRGVITSHMPLLLNPELVPMGEWSHAYREWRYQKKQEMRNGQ